MNELVPALPYLLEDTENGVFKCLYLSKLWLILLLWVMEEKLGPVAEGAECKRDDGGTGPLPASSGSRNRIFWKCLLLLEAPERTTLPVFLEIWIRSGPTLTIGVLLGAVVWADGQLAPAQHGHGSLRSPGSLRDGVLRVQWGAVGSRGELKRQGGCSWDQGSDFP